MVRAVQDDGAAFAQAAAQLEPDVRLLKVNTEEQQAAAARFGIRGIPTMVLFAGGREVQRCPGRWTPAALSPGAAADPLNHQAQTGARVPEAWESIRRGQ